MPKSPTICILVGILSVLATAVSEAENPAAPGFDSEGSDAQAIEIADQVMERLGGRQAWDETRFVTWSFFGRRRHVWDKHIGDIRIEGVDRETGEPYLILMNLNSGKGRAWTDGREVVDSAALSEMLERGESIWINDSYWMFMPYKLKDTGVTLRYAGEGSMENGRAADILQLTFQNVGRTPENKYLIYVAKDTGLVEQWDFFKSSNDDEPGFRSPWQNWQAYGDILLSDNRGENGHTDLAVLEQLPAEVFSSPEPVDWGALIP